MELRGSIELKALFPLQIGPVGPVPELVEGELREPGGLGAETWIS